MIFDGTMALCATCRRAITAWNDVFLPLSVDAPPTQHVTWLHFFPDESHTAMPLPSKLLPVRVLICSRCHRPQVRDAHGWRCPNCDHT